MVARTLAHYQLLEKLGEGAMGEVYHAIDVRLGRAVAIKALKTAASGADKSRFLREARTVSRIDHPNVVTIFDVVEEDDSLYLVMQYVQGRTLRELMVERRPEVGEALRIAGDVAAGLKAAHAIGVVHRDIKPANVMVLPDGSSKILDFGVAHLAEADYTTLTASGTVVGTLHYMAPEQLAGKPVDPRADIYSLGVVLYEMLSGRVPFAGREAGPLVHDIVSREPVPLPRLVRGLPQGVAAVVSKAMAKRPEDRYAGADELGHDLELVTNGLSAAEHSTRTALTPATTGRASDSTRSPSSPFSSPPCSPFPTPSSACAAHRRRGSWSFLFTTRVPIPASIGFPVESWTA